MILPVSGARPGDPEDGDDPAVWLVSAEMLPAPGAPWPGAGWDEVYGNSPPGTWVPVICVPTGLPICVPTGLPICVPTGLPICVPTGLPTWAGV
jgi:hypothetical protein